MGGEMSSIKVGLLNGPKKSKATPLSRRAAVVEHPSRSSLKGSNPIRQVQTLTDDRYFSYTIIAFIRVSSSRQTMSRFRALLQASLNATKRALTWNVEDMMPSSELNIFNFNSKEEIDKWHLYSDSEYGGMSSASLEITDSETGLRGIFSGNLSTDLAGDSRWKINRSGFCGMRSKKFNGFIDLDAYDTITMRLKGDGRCYISTIYTENWVNSPAQQEDNSWQTFVLVPKGVWHTLKLPLDQYLPTWRGNVIDVNLEMNPSRIVGMSLSVNAEAGFPGAHTGPGDFKLEIGWIKALRTL